MHFVDKNSIHPYIYDVEALDQVGDNSDNDAWNNSKLPVKKGVLGTVVVGLERFGSSHHVDDEGSRRDV